jgi:hypothetical protein
VGQRRGDVRCVVGSCRESQVSAFGTRNKTWGLRSRRVEAPVHDNGVPLWGMKPVSEKMGVGRLDSKQ